jgi:hypothetical protein
MLQTPYLYVPNESGGLADISLLCTVISFKESSFYDASKIQW